MRSNPIMIAIATALAVSAVQADITFDFNELDYWKGDTAISDYMTDEYGSSVMTDDAMTGLSIDFTDSPFIGTMAFSGWDGNFDITFDGEPIIGARFQGRVFFPSGGADFDFRAYSGDDLVASFSRNNCFEIFTTDWLAFDTPVDRLRFSNLGIHSVGIDDLTVRKATDSVIPAPGAIVLVVLGLGVVGAVKLRTWQRPSQ